MATTPTNPAVFSPALLRQPIAESRTLLVTQPWARWMQASWGRQGGAQAPSNAELDSGLGETNDNLGQTQDDLEQTQDDVGALTSRVTTLETQVGALTTRVTTLETTVAALTARIAALEGRVDALETTAADHETRLTALETAPSQGVQLRRVAVQTIAANTLTVVAFDTLGMEQGEFWNAATPSQIRIPATNWYTAVAQIDWAAQNQGTRDVIFYRNGVASLVVNRISGSTVPTAQQITAISYLTAGDTLEVRVQHTSNQTLEITAYVSLALTEGHALFVAGPSLQGHAALAATVNAVRNALAA